MDSTPARPPRRGLVARGYAAIVVGLRHFVALAWIAIAVAATVALPSLGNAPAAPLDDLAAKGGSAAARAGAGHPHVRLPAGHRHRRRPARPARALPGRPAPPGRRRAGRPRPLGPRAGPPARRRPDQQRERPHPVRREGHDGDHLPALRAGHEPRRGVHGLPALCAADAGRPTRRRGGRHRRGPRARGAVPRDRAGAAADRGRQRRAHRPHRGPRLPLDRRAAGGARRGGHRLRDHDAGAAVARRARERHRAQGDRARRRRAAARPGHRLLDLLPVRDAPPAARGRRAPRRPRAERSRRSPRSSSPPG